MSVKLPSLPNTNYRLATGGGWEEDRITGMDGYSDDDMHDYAAPLLERIALLEVDNAKLARDNLDLCTIVQKCSGMEAIVAENNTLRDRAERLAAELAKANNEFGSQTAEWPDLWKRIAEIKQYGGEQWRRAERLEAALKELLYWDNGKPEYDAARALISKEK